MADIVKDTATTYGMGKQVSLHPILQLSVHSCWPPSANVTNQCSYSSTPPYAFMTWKTTTLPLTFTLPFTLPPKRLILFVLHK